MCGIGAPIHGAENHEGGWWMKGWMDEGQMSEGYIDE